MGIQLDDLLLSMDQPEPVRRFNGDIDKKLPELKRHVRELILEIDQLMSRQVTIIINNDRFKKMEERWRGLLALTNSVEDRQRVKIKFLDYNWETLSADLNQSSTVERSYIFQLVAVRELNTLGGEPFGMLVLDHEISNDIEGDFDELYTLELLGTMGERSLCPLILGTCPDFFGNAASDWLSDTNRIGKILQTSDYDGLNTICQSSASRFIGLTLNRVCARLPYEYFGRHFCFREKQRDDGGLWIGAQYVFASTVIREFSRTAWFGYLKMVSEDPGVGAVVGHLEFGVPEIHQPNGPLRPWVRLTNQMGDFFSEAGFIPLVDGRISLNLFFWGNSSLKARLAKDSDRVLSQIQSIMISCRIAHFVKVLMRSLIGQVMTREEIQQRIYSWLEPYVRDLATAAPAVLAQYPLKNAEVVVEENPYERGQFSCELRIVPQYQVDRMLGEIRLRTELGTTEARR